MFWLGVGGGSLLIVHFLTLLFLRWRMGTSVKGMLSVPRFELLFVILMLPCISQSSAFVIRGKKIRTMIFISIKHPLGFYELKAASNFQVAPQRE